MNNVFQPGFGPQLKAAREAQGLSVADVAAKLKLTTRQIENLEGENFAQLPGEIFVRGFVRNYARLVGLDSEQLLLPVEAAQTVAETITAPSEGLTFTRPGVKRWILLPAISGLLFLVLVAILYHWLREGEEALVVEPVTVQPLTVQPQALPATDPAVPAAAPAIPDPAAVPGVPPAASSALPVAPTAPSPASAMPPAASGVAPIAPPPVPALSKPPAPAPQPPVVTPPAPKPAPIVTPPPPPAKPVVKEESSGGNLRFNAQADAWIQVSDSKGKRFSKLVKAGTVELFAGVPPFTLVVGEAAQVKLSYKGQNVDLAPFIGEKVARLTLE